MRNILWIGVFLVFALSSITANSVKAQVVKTQDYNEYTYGLTFSLTGSSVDTNICKYMHLVDEIITKVLLKGGSPYVNTERFVESKICGVMGKVHHMLIPSMPEYDSPNMFQMEYTGWIPTSDISNSDELRSLQESMDKLIPSEVMASILHEYIPPSPFVPTVASSLSITPDYMYSECFAGVKLQCGVIDKTIPENWEVKCMRCDPSMLCSEANACASRICNGGVCGEYYIDTQHVDGGEGSGEPKGDGNNVVGVSLKSVILFAIIVYFGLF